jgi:hypothetical protein
MRSNGAVTQQNNSDYGGPPYTTQYSHNSSNKENDMTSIPSQLCDVVVHCATVLPRTNTNTSSIHSNDPPPGQHINFNGGQNGGSNNGSFPGNPNGSHRDTIMPMPSEANQYQAGWQAGRLHSQPSVASSMHSSRPGTGQGQAPDMFHTPPCQNNNMGQQDSRWEPPRDNFNMNVGHSHAGAFNNNQQNGWNQSGPPTDSSQGARQRNTYRMESGAYDAGYRDAMAQLQRSLG